MVVSYVAWRADRVLYGSYTLDTDSDNVGSCLFVQDRALAICHYGENSRNVTFCSLER